MKFCLFLFSISVFLSQDNQLVYRQTITVPGDKNTFYGVILKNGNQNHVRTIRVNRHYSAPGPTGLSGQPTTNHKGALALEIKANYGGWGGQSYGWRVDDLRYAYVQTFANAFHTGHSKQFALMLRGGGFEYLIESDEPLTIQITQSNTELIYDHSNNGYDVYAPTPITEVNQDNIDKHTLGNWKSFKGEPKVSSSFKISTKTITGSAESISEPSWGNNQNHIIDKNSWTSSFGDYRYISNFGNQPESSNRAIMLSDSKGFVFGSGTTDGNGISDANTLFKVDNAGTVSAKKIKVTTQVGADFVFEDDYDLRSLEKTEKFIKENKHLPEIPSAKEMKEKGLDMSDFQIKLLQKIEEQTLHMIEMNKQIKKLQNELKALKGKK